jgi:hypothetical protein
MEERIARWLGKCVPVMLVLLLLVGIFVPVYTDEIGWRLQERAGFDGVDKLFNEACGPNTLAAPPWFMMPVRWYSAIFNGAFPDPFWIRFSGVLYALVWVALVFVLVRRVAERRDDRAIVSAIGFGLMGLGTMPFVMVWSRPEQPIALAAVAALVLAFADGIGPSRPLSTARQAWGRSVAIWALTCIAASYHVKGLLLLPLMLACLFFASHGRKSVVPRLTLGALTLVTTASAVAYWSSRMACPGDAILRMSTSDNLSGAVASVSSVDQAHDLLGTLLANISIFRYVATISPHMDPMSSWLAPNQISDAASFQWFLVISLAWALALMLGVGSAMAGLVQSVRERRLDPRPILAFIAGGVAVVWTSMQHTIRNVYESKFILLLLVLAIMLGLSSYVSERLKAARMVVTVFVGVFAVISPIAITALYAPSLERAARQQGHLSAQPFSLGVFGFAKVRPQIEAAAKLCGIVDPAKAHALMVDDATYLPFVRAPLPQHVFGVLGQWKGEIDDPIAYLKSRGSTGAVVSCHYLDPALRARAKRVGDYCCLGPPNW